MILGLIAGGLYSVSKVPVDAVPDITNNQVLVITTAPNLGTEDIEKFVTCQIELAVANLPDVTEIRSVSRFGLSVVTIVFEDDAGTYLPRQLVSEALIEIKDKIPEGFGKPFMAPVSSGLGEIYQYTLEVQDGFEDKYDDTELRSIQDWIVKRQTAMLPGVVEVNSFGGHVKQYEVAVNPDKLRSMNISISEVFEALKNNNQNTGGAYIEKNHQANFIRGEGLMRSLDDIKNTLVKNVKGNPVFIRDIAEVKFGSFVRYGAFTKDGKGEAVGGIVMMLKGGNSNDVINNIKERMKLIQKSLPEGIIIKPFLDRSKLIKSTTSTVSENLAIGALIVIFILVLFLGNLRGGLIVASTIPLALLFAFIMMHIFDVWANLMSLGALDFGILIDGAVIIVESMIYILHKKNLTGQTLKAKERDELAYKSASEMMNSAFFGQLIILIVFVPILALQGIEGKMFIPMAMTFGFAVLGVMFLSLTYIPAASANFLKPPKNAKKSVGDKIIQAIENLYKPLFYFALNKSKLIIAFALSLLILSGFIFSKMGAEFIPKLDEGDFAFQAFLKPGTSLSEVKEASVKIQKIVLENYPDEIESIQARIGVATLPTDPMPMDIADIFVILKPQEQWTKTDSKAELIAGVKEKISVLPGINYEFTQPIEMRFNELLTGIREDIAVKLYGDDLDILANKAAEISSLVSDIKGVAGVKAEAVKGLPQITIKYNRNKLAQYGLNISDVSTATETAFSGSVAGQIYEGERMFDLVVRLDKTHRRSIKDVENLFISLDGGNQIPLKELANISYQNEPMQISRDNTNRRTYVGINVAGRDIKSLVDEIKTKLDAELELPSGYYIRYGGAFENLERATERLTLVVPLSLALIFILVFFAVKSLKQTLMIYLAIPFAATGGIFSLYLRGMPLSISAGIGFIVLFGVAVLNGLVLINGFNELKSSGKFTLTEIIVKGSVRRIRPILLTASTDILGFLPMAVSASAGAEVQRPLATVVIGGMLTATVLSLLVLPVLYRRIEQGSKINFGKRKIPLVLIIMLGISATTQRAVAQDTTTTFTLEKAIETAKNNYPKIKSANLEIEKQKALKLTAYDFGNTTIFTGKDEVGHNETGIRNIIGIEQNDIDIFKIKSKQNAAEAKIKQAQAFENQTIKEAEQTVGLAWNEVLYRRKQLDLVKASARLYADFEKAAALKYKTGESSKIELLSASASYKKQQINVLTSEANYNSALQNLNLYLRAEGKIQIDTSGLSRFSEFEIPTENSLSSNPELAYYTAQTNLAKLNRKAEKAEFLPKLNVGYQIQSINGVSGYSSWQVGLSAPLIFFSQSGKSKAAKLDYEIANQAYLQKRLDLQLQYQQLINQYLMLKALNDYYKNDAIPLINEQIKAADSEYQSGNIDYIQFMQIIDNSTVTKQDFLTCQYELYQTVILLKYFNGN